MLDEKHLPARLSGTGASLNRWLARPYQKATRHRATLSRKLLSVFLGARWKGRPIEPKNLYDGHRHAVSCCGDSTSAADHLRMAGGDRRLEHSILGELARRSCGRCACIFRLYPEAVAQRGRLPVADERVRASTAIRIAPCPSFDAHPLVRASRLDRIGVARLPMRFGAEFARQSKPRPK
jgi:hypothetical protein